MPELTLPALSRQNSQCFIFVFFHDLPLPWPFVVDAAQMKDSVDDGTMQFFVVWSFELFRICFYCIQTDEKVA